MPKLRALVNGCSFSRGPTAWPYFLETVDQSNLTNLACAGAGNTYIHETTVSALANFHYYDIVLVMWTGVNRVDLKVAEPMSFANTIYSSRHQSLQNNWETKVIEPFDDQTLVEKDWIFGCGHYNGEPALKQTQAFDGIYLYQDIWQFQYNFLQKVIALQNTLLYMGIPYVFMFYMDYIQELYQHENLCKLIKWNNCLTNKNLHNIATQHNWFDPDGCHPGIKAHQTWAGQLDEFIKERT